MWSPMKWVTIFFVTWSTIGCADFNKLFTEDTNGSSDSDEMMTINFLIRNISAKDIRIVATESFFDRNYMAIAGGNDVSFTLLNIDRHFTVNGKYPIAAVVILFLDFQHQWSGDINKLWEMFKRNRVIAIGNDCMDSKTFDDYFRLSWSKNLLNLIILNNCNETADVYTYFPFANNQCRTFTTKNIMKLGSFSINTSLKPIQFKSEYMLSVPASHSHINSFPFFPDKVPLNLNRCPVRILTGIWPPNVINITSVDEAGIEMEFIKTMEHHLNCNLSIHTDEKDDMGLTYNENEEPTGRMGLLKNEKFDLHFGAVPSVPNVFRDFDTTDCFLQNQLKFIVPTAGRLPSSMILWTVLEKHTTLFYIVIAVVLLQSILIRCMHRLSYKENERINNDKWFIIRTFINLLRSLIETSTPHLPDNKIIRWIYGIWFGSCLIISCFFTTNLTATLAEPGHLEQLKSISDIIKSNIPLSIDSMYYPILAKDAEQLKYFIAKNVNATVPVGLKLASIGQAATFTDVLRARHISVQWVSSTGDRSIYYVGGNKILTYWQVMVSYKGNILIERINDLMKRINENGFWRFQLKRYYNRRLIRTMIRQYLIVYNFQHAINNTNAINQLNEGFKDSFEFDGSITDSERLLLETDEDDIIRRFVRSDKTLITWDHLSAVFQVWFIGMLLATLVFLSELLNFKLSKHKIIIWNRCDVE